MDRLEAHQRYRQAVEVAEKSGKRKQLLRKLAQKDLFFLLVYLLGRKDADKDWVFDRCREFEAEPDGYLDEWPREHYKSTIITFAAAIQAILQDPGITIGIFSFNRPIAKAFLRQIKREFEDNQKLKSLFPDILFAQPQKESPKWSEDEGIIVRRRANPKEATVEAWGLVDGQPTSKHFTLLIYDDVVTKDSVTTPDMIQKVTDSFATSLNLGAEGGRRRAAGTRYHYADTYSEMIKRGTFKLRLYAATKDGTLEGEPWLWTRDTLAQKVRDQGPYIAACQLFNDPKQDKSQGFRDEWLRYWPADQFRALNTYILCDPANEKKDSNDYTVFWVVGLGADRNYYIIDMVRDRLSLTERANVLFTLHQRYHPKQVGYERYGMQADIAHYQDRMKRDNYRFNIEELGGSTPKFDRIRQLVPLFQQGRVWLPERCVRSNYEGITQDLTQAFINDEYMAFPFSAHDDMLDSLARIVDPKLSAVFPQGDLLDPLGYFKQPEARRSPSASDFDPLSQPL
jgi:predicted phage terminase large subunit-like protein